MIFLRDDSPDVTPMQRAEANIKALAQEYSVTISAEAGPALGKLREVMVQVGRGMGKTAISQEFMAKMSKVGGIHVTASLRDEASQSHLYNHHTAGPASDEPPVIVKPCTPMWDLFYLDDLTTYAEEEKKDRAKAAAKGNAFCSKGHKMKGGFCRRCSR